ncbi:hypothetical protein PISMIDRAFT_169514 [Pisolithus microcarpus 441]|uniref:SAP domain-containing protein n=1 Tax=Pisolithus microcarpus 441 TaxID=765257 RepID=A0A0C9YYG5_9AGAM|nr:hypothetical protein PISMIDRAFT_169514 [Pisolithus microcarpus 441]
MLRSVLQQSATRRLPLHARTFVSTVLLSRTWENETVVDLRKEARQRGLSTGNKPALIARLQEYEESKVAPPSQNPSPPSRDVPGASRKASSRAAPTSDPATPATLQGSSPAGTPPSSERHNPSASAEFFAFKMPDLDQPTPSSSAQVPYLPDFWDSARSNSTFTDPDPEPPKLHVVGGAVTHHDGGPTHHLEKPLETGTVQPVAPVADDVIVIKSANLQELFADLGIPTTIRLRPVVDTTVVESPIQSRPLTSEETTGVYALLGILVGSWVLGGILSPRPEVEDESLVGEQH